MADSPFSGPKKEDNRRAQTPMDLSRFPFYFCSLSHHIPPLTGHSPSTVREGFVCCDG